MPTKIKLALSFAVLATGAGGHWFENHLGNNDRAWIAAGLSVFMVLAIWIFPEAAEKQTADR